MNTTIRMQSITFNPPKEYRFEDLVTVKRIIAVASVLMTLSLVALGASTAQGSSLPGWNSSLKSGVSNSKSSGKPMIVVIARDGCGACEQMESELARPENARALKNAVRVRVEANRNPDFTARYATGGTPTTLVFEAGNSSAPVYSFTGVMNSDVIRQLGRSIDSMRN